MISETDLRWRGNEIVMRLSGKRVAQVIPRRKKAKGYRVAVAGQIVVCNDIRDAHAMATQMVLKYLNEGANK